MISPFASRHWLASELTVLLEEAGCTAKDLAAQAGVDPRKISYLLKAERKPTSVDVVRILKHLPVPASRRQLLIEAAEAAEREGWWERYSIEMGSRQAKYADLEAGSRKLEYAQTFVPGLLQTQEYATVRALADQAYYSKRFLVSRAVEARALRQRILSAAPPCAYDVILDEAIFRRAAAPAAVIENQINHMLAVAMQIPGVTIRILRLETPLPGAPETPLPGNTVPATSFSIPATSFSIYQYPQLNDLQIVAVETDDDDLFVTNPAKAAAYRKRYERLCSAADDPAESLDFLIAESENQSRKARRSA